MAIFESGTWPADIAQLLDDHHLVVLSDKPAVRGRFREVFSDYLASLLETQIININGSRITDMGGFCRELKHHLPNGHTPDSSLPGIVKALRQWPGARKRMYFLWHDADATLDSDVQLFSRLVNAMLAVAAEHEHINPHRLILQRTVFLGNSKLGAYAEDQSGQFSRWLADHETTRADLDEDFLFWEVQSCVERPPVLTYRIDG